MMLLKLFLYGLICQKFHPFSFSLTPKMLFMILAEFGPTTFSFLYPFLKSILKFLVVCQFLTGVSYLIRLISPVVLPRPGLYWNNLSKPRLIVPSSPISLPLIINDWKWKWNRNDLRLRLPRAAIFWIAIWTGFSKIIPFCLPWRLTSKLFFARLLADRFMTAVFKIWES